MGLTADQLANVVDALRRLKADTPTGIQSLHTGHWPYVVLEPEVMADLFPDAEVRFDKHLSQRPFSITIHFGDVDVCAFMSTEEAAQLYPEQYAALQAGVLP